MSKRPLKMDPKNVYAREYQRRRRKEKPDEARAYRKKQYPKRKAGIMARTRARRLADPAQYLLEKAQRRARQRRLTFALSKTDIVIPEVCPVLKIPITVLSKTHDNSPTIDRRVNYLGYIPSNVAVISRRANRIKSDATLDELKKIVEWMESQERDRHSPYLEDDLEGALKTELDS